MSEVLLELSEKQKEFAKAALSGKYTQLLYGGAIRGGKTVCVLALLFVLCKVYRGSRWAVVRKDLPTLRRNTIPSFKKFAPEGFIGPINQGTWEATCSNGSTIIFFPESISGDKDLDRWKGLEVNGFILEEANELSEQSYFKAMERAGSWLTPGSHQPDPLILMTCNPAKNWVKKRFHDKHKNGLLNAPFFYVPAKITDNPFLTEGYLRSLEIMKEQAPAEYRRFVEGDWESADDPEQLIEWSWVNAAVERGKKIKAAGKRKLGVDVARYGSDSTAICEQVGDVVVALEYHQKLSTAKTARIVQRKIHELPVDASNVKIDGVGLGAGVVDPLRADGLMVKDVIAGAGMIDRTTDDGDGGTVFAFKNLRSQLWWEYREGLRTGRISIAVDDQRLLEDLTAPRYRVKGDKVIQVEPKDDLKVRLGRSPDAADAAILADADIPDDDDNGFFVII